MAPWILGLTLTVIGIRVVTLTNNKSYLEFPEDAEVKQSVRQLRELQAAAPRSARVGGSWEYAGGINYYRLRYRLRWLAKPDRDGSKAGYDYYVLRPKDAGLIDQLGLRKVWTGPQTGIIVAVP